MIRTKKSFTGLHVRFLMEATLPNFGDCYELSNYLKNIKEAHTLPLGPYIYIKKFWANFKKLNQNFDLVFQPINQQNLEMSKNSF